MLTGGTPPAAAPTLYMPEERTTYSTTLLVLPLPLPLPLPLVAVGSTIHTCIPPRGTKMMGLPHPSSGTAASTVNGLGLGLPALRLGGVSSTRFGESGATSARFLGSFSSRYITACVQRTALADHRGLATPPLSPISPIELPIVRSATRSV